MPAMKKITRPTNCGMTNGRNSPCRDTISGRLSERPSMTTPSTLSASATSYETSCAQVRIEPRIENFDSEAQPPTMKPYTPIEPSAKIRSNAIGTFATSPFTYQPLIVQPGPNGITEKAASAVNMETTGAAMYGIGIAPDGANASLRISFTRSAIGCRSPNGPARFGP